MILDTVFQCLVMGALYANITVGIALVLGILRIINFVHGEFYMFGAWGAFYIFYKGGVNFWLALVLTLIVTGGFGVLMERGFFRPIYGKFLQTVVVAIALITLISHSSLWIFGADDRGVPAPYPGVTTIFGATLSTQRVLLFVCCSILIGLVYYVVQHTNIGRFIRAVGQNRELASLYGISLRRIHMWCMGIGCGLAGMAGALAAPVFSVNVFLGEPAVFKALLIMVIGGMGSVPGGVLAAFLVSFMEGFGYLLISEKIELLTFVIVIIFLLVRPRGLMGLKYEVN